METTSRTMSVSDDDLYGFIFEQIDTVPHLEALLQLWHSRPRAWSDAEIAERLFVDPGAARAIMADLVRRSLVRLPQDTSNFYAYLPSPENDPLVEALARAYRTDLIRVSTAIHAKASSGVREFARAFQFKRKGKKP